MESGTENPAEGLLAGQCCVASNSEALRGLLDGFFRARKGWVAGIYSTSAPGLTLHGDSEAAPVLVCQGQSAAEILSTLGKMPIRWPVLVRPAQADDDLPTVLPRERYEWREMKQRFWSTAVRAKRAALKRGDKEFLAEAAAFFRSPHDVPAGLLPGGGRGREPDRQHSRRMIGMLENAQVKPNGGLTNFKRTVGVAGLGKREHGELVRFCVGIFGNVADGIEGIPDVANRHGFKLPEQWSLFQKALRIGLNYARPKPGPYTLEQIQRLLRSRCP